MRWGDPGGADRVFHLDALRGEVRALHDLVASLLDAPEPLPGVLVAHEHGGALARAVYRAKYDGDPSRAARLGALLLPLTARLAGPVGCVLPVPLHPRRLRQRGYNQSMELARPVARALGCPLLAEALVRTRDTPTQTTLARAEREANVAGVFRAALKTDEGRKVLSSGFYPAKFEMYRERLRSIVPEPA